MFDRGECARRLLVVDLVAGLRGQHQDVRRSLTLGVVGREYLLGGLEAGLAGQGEVEGQPFGGGAGCRAADQEGDDPEKDHKTTVPEAPTCERRHRGLPTS